MPALSVIIPSLGAPTLRATFDSILSQEQSFYDEVLVVGDGPQPFALALVEETGPPFRYLEHGPRHNWGNPQRNFGIEHAAGDYLVWMDEDDVFLPGAFAAIRRVGAEHPGRPLMFRFYPNDGRLLWERKGEIRQGGTGGHQFVTPNVPGRVGRWGSTYEGDYTFVTSTLALYPEGAAAVVWREEVIARCRPHLR